MAIGLFLIGAFILGLVVCLPTTRNFITTLSLQTESYHTITSESGEPLSTQPVSFVKVPYYGPAKFLGVWFSIKLDSTPVSHALIASLMCLVSPWGALLFYFSKELREGTGDPEFIGLGKALQGFGGLDFGAVVIVCSLWILFDLPSYIHISTGGFSI